MDTLEVMTIAIAAYGAILATYTLIIQIREKVRKLKVSFAPGFIETAGDLGETMLILECSNPGHVDVTATGHAILPPGGSQIIFRAPETEHQFPHTLTPGKRSMMWFPAKEVAASLKRHGFSGTVKIRGSVKEATGKSYNSRPLKFNVDHWLSDKNF